MTTTTAATPRASIARDGLASILGMAASTCVFIFLAAPLVVIAGSSLTSGNLLSFPPDGLSLKWYGEVLGDQDWRAAFTNSLVVAAATTLLTVGVAVPAAYAVGRAMFPGAVGLSMFLLSPLLVPEVMLGVALLNYTSDLGIASSYQAVVAGHVVLTLPFVMRLILISVVELDPRLENAAEVLGASRAYVFWRVIVPLLRPGVLAGAIFAFVISMGEVAITMFVAGPDTTTVPVQLFNLAEYGFDPTIAAASGLLILLAIPALAAIERWVGLSRLF